MSLLHDCKLSAAPGDVLHATSKMCAVIQNSGWNCAYKKRKENTTPVGGDQRKAQG